MAERNFAAGVQMTMDSVVRNYLRWFELMRCKKEIRDARLFPELRRIWPRSVFSSPAAPLQSGPTDELAASNALSIDFAQSLAWRKVETPKDHPDGDGYLANSTLEGDY
jgi:hypothetical protein